MKSSSRRAVSGSCDWTFHLLSQPSRSRGESVVFCSSQQAFTTKRRADRTDVQTWLERELKFLLSDDQLDMLIGVRIWHNRRFISVPHSVGFSGDFISCWHTRPLE
jgi:hypothetical protein